ncbi:hypothetical protein NKK48_30355 [Mesorhizobium sp. C386A]|uniref:hypothetical protein n=1 Tax=Mesorhizobium sp. C386A TaxID=2956831 RepID=UPI00333B1823
MITQEQFDRVYLGLAAQGWQRSYSDHHMQCMYRGPKNCKCAIASIDDDEYIPKWITSRLASSTLMISSGVACSWTWRSKSSGICSRPDSNDFPREMNAAFDTSPASTA